MVPFLLRRDQGEEFLIIRARVENVLTVVAPGKDVIKTTPNLETRFRCHSASSLAEEVFNQYDDQLQKEIRSSTSGEAARDPGRKGPKHRAREPGELNGTRTQANSL